MPNYHIYFFYQRFDKEAAVWRAKSTKDPSFAATSEASYATILLATHIYGQYIMIQHFAQINKYIQSMNHSDDKKQKI